MKFYFPYGLNENQYPDIGEAAQGSYNFELSKTTQAFKPRKPCDLAGTAANAGDIRGIMQLVKRSGAQTTLIQSGAIVYEWDGGATFTSRGTVNATSKLRDTYWSLTDILIITDLQKLTVVKQWDGTTLSDLTTGLGVSLYAKYGVVHKGRVWLFNVTAGTDTPHLMVASAFENPVSYNTSARAGDSSFVTGNEAFYMVAPDLKPINGVVVFHNQLVISTQEGRLFRLSGNDSTNFIWEEFYAGSAAIGDESIVNVGNDVMYMRAGGNIESLVATQAFGDVATDDLSRFIPETVKNLTGAIAVYDQTNQKVFFFVDNKVLVLFKDILPTGFSPWSIYQTQMTNNFDTQAAKYMRRPGTSNFTIYWGDNAGRIYDVNGEGAGDGGNTDIITTRKTRLVDDTVTTDDFTKNILAGRVQYRRLSECSLTLDFDWADEYNVSNSIIQLKGPPTGDTGIYFGGSFYFGESIYFSEGFLFAQKISSRGFSPTGKGPGFILQLSVETDQDFQVDNVEIPA